MSSCGYCSWISGDGVANLGKGLGGSLETEAIPEGVGSPGSAGLVGERSVKVLQEAFWGAGDPL